jgi:hypothetical protein
MDWVLTLPLPTAYPRPVINLLSLLFSHVSLFGILVAGPDVVAAQEIKPGLHNSCFSISLVLQDFFSWNLCPCHVTKPPAASWARHWFLSTGNSWCQNMVPAPWAGLSSFPFLCLIIWGLFTYHPPREAFFTFMVISQTVSPSLGSCGVLVQPHRLYHLPVCALTSVRTVSYSSLHTWLPVWRLVTRGCVRNI